MARITFSGHNLERAFTSWSRDVENEIEKIVLETVRMIQAQARLLAPADDGSLKASIEVRQIDKFSATVTVGAEYAVYVEFGTGIYATEGNGRQTPWTYWSNKLGRYVTTKGQKPQQFWSPAVESGERHFTGRMNRLFR
ncbi:HK97-gp10 family putative phage morphogenesis protein [Viridibacillus arvi]|uniref:HK97-gp10 family putative phage morphogenesis protein n=1 Tax=Viridibacillus arvi TaxID=263475 RepID=UPI0036A65B4E